MEVTGKNLLITTQDNFSDYEIVETLGLVRGNTIRARHVGKDILAGLRSIVGGEITEYTKMLAESREQAIDRMFSEAVGLGADGIVCIRFTTSTVMASAAELLAYGTAVKLRKK
ncbi:MAG: YbjQ family protein [Bacteroidetes bacterium]|nr:MAG: YbjQ family protein [Bacteroidota bacterium]